MVRVLSVVPGNFILFLNSYGSKNEIVLIKSISPEDNSLVLHKSRLLVSFL